MQVCYSELRAYMAGQQLLVYLRRGCSAPAGPQIAGEHLALVDAHVRVAHQCADVIGNIAAGQTLLAPVPGDTDRVYGFAVDHEGAHPPRHQCPAFDLATRRDRRHPIAVIDVFLACQFRTHFDKQFRH